MSNIKTRADQVKRGYIDRSRDDVPFWELEYEDDRARYEPDESSQVKAPRRSA